MDKIQFIVCGWWYDEFDKKTGQTDFIESLQYLNGENDNIDIFLTCHKKTTKDSYRKF